MIPQAHIDPQRLATNLEQGWWRAEETLVDDFLAAVDRFGDKAAIVAHRADRAELTTLTYRQLRTLVDRCALGLLQLGVGRGDVVSFQLPNWWQFPVVAMACARMGAVMNPILPIFRAREVSYILGALESKVLVMPATFRRFDYPAMLDGFRRDLPHLEHVLIADAGAARLPDGYERFEATLLDRRWEDEVDRSALDARRPSPNDIAEIQFTSGTTGHPKGVVHTFNTVHSCVEAIRLPLGFGPDDVVLTPSTMAHQTAYVNGFGLALSTGMKSVLQDVWDPAAMLQLIQDERVTYTSGAAPFMVDVCEVAEQKAAEGIGYDTSSLKYFKSGGSAVPSVVHERMRATLGASVVMSWGMTENGCLTITRADARPEETAASDGFPMPWAELKVTDFDGTPLPPGASGVLWIKGASQCVDYYPDHEVFVNSYDADGWFNTGDLARINPDGSLRITGRVKDMIIRGGENIPVTEVENALATHPSVAEAAVVPVPDDRLGERAWAVLVPSRGVDDVDIDDLKRHLEELGMAKQYWPEYFSVRHELPRTASGKIRKNEVRDAVLAEFEQARTGDTVAG